MNFLFTIQPSLAHLHPIIPIAQELRRLDHSIRFATARSFLPPVRRAGFDCFAAGVDFLCEDVGATWPDWHEVPEQRRGAFDLEIFASRCAPGMAHDLVGAATEWKPDLIVRDLWEFGGYVAAEALRIPHAVIGLSGGVNLPLSAIGTIIGPPIAAARRRYELPDDPELSTLFKYLRLDLVPPSYRLPGVPVPPVAHTIRPVSFDRTVRSEPPGWIHDLPRERTILVTLGSVYNRHPDVFRRVVDGARELDVNVIVTVGTTQAPDILGAQPRHVRVERYVPFTSILDRLSAVVTHGGFTTVMTALAGGLPLVFIPISADHPSNARRFTELGAGVTIERDELTAEVARDALRQVLQSDRYSGAAARLRAELDSLPGPDVAAQMLERLARCRAPIRRACKEPG